MIDDDRRLLDIRDAAERIASHAGGGRDAFDQDELIQVWMVHHLQIIGEAYVDEPAASRVLLAAEDAVKAGGQVEVREYVAA